MERHTPAATALTASWDSLFEGVYKAYETILPMSGHAAG
jgi:hypothetical protein